MRCGLLGRKLGHSYSPAIHARLGNYSYELVEKEPEELEAFLASGEFQGLNVTIPYKKAVVPYCRELSAQARALGSVNTLVRRPDGSWYGHNTDYEGFRYLVETTCHVVAGSKALVLGSGGAGVTVAAALRDMGARVVVISRNGEDNYENLPRHGDAQLIVNATPVGMYPNNGQSPVDLTLFPQCCCVLDVIYNPARTALLLQAEELGMAAYGGLAMLVAQAAGSSRCFTGQDIPAGRIQAIEQELRQEMENIILVGMPGCGKSTVAQALSRRTGRTHQDSDALVVQRCGMSIPELFARQGEEAFRRLETEVLSDLGKASGTIIATGGGCVTRRENRCLLRQNGTVVFLRRPLELLPTDGRPLSQAGDLAEMYRRRLPLYEDFAHITVDNTGTPEDTADAILRAIKEERP